MIILCLLKLGITILIHNKDDIEFVTEFPCFLGHPVNPYFILTIILGVCWHAFKISGIQGSNGLELGGIQGLVSLIYAKFVFFKKNFQ